MSDMDVSKLIERLNANLTGAALANAAQEAALALTAERERADKAEADYRDLDEFVGKGTMREMVLKNKALRAERNDLTRKMAEAETGWKACGAALTDMEVSSLTQQKRAIEAEHQLAEADIQWANTLSRAVAAERQLAEAVEVVKRWLKADDIGIGLDIREARESARAFIQKQEAGHD